jgi:outer membrane receptor for ferric coprogen and ferric-rhodotorulic acid
VEEVLDAETITEEVVAEEVAEADSQEDVKAEILAEVTEETVKEETEKVEVTEEILVAEIVKVVSIVKVEVVSDQELHQLEEAIEEVLILAIAEEEGKVVQTRVVQQKEEVLDLKEQEERQEDQTTNF